MSPTAHTKSHHNPSSGNLSREISLYSLTAAAAGVSLLALASPAESEVVITKRTIEIPVTEFGQPSLGLSLVNNGVNDFYFRLASTFSGASTHLELELDVANADAGRGIMATFQIGAYFSYASALKRGARIGPSANFLSAGQGEVLEVSFTTFSGGHRLVGKWGGDPKNRYLGVRFVIDGRIHFGWVRVAVTTDNVHGMTAKITGYAYETVPNKPILAGTAATAIAGVQAPEDVKYQGGPSLGMLAVGADGLQLWRREEALGVQ
jgi:hypothetical protein